jgi:hypothetical protein
VRQAIDVGAEPLFRDIHTMLRLPLPASGLDAGCAYSIFHVLLSIVGGASVLFYSAQGGSGSLFRQFLLQFYPWNLEPKRDGLCVDEEAVDQLYEEFRNRFTHALGLAVKTQKDMKTRRLEERATKLVVKRLTDGRMGLNAGLSEAMIEQLEMDGRPSWLSPSLVRDSPYKIIGCPEALYWGIRKATEAVCRDQDRMQRAAEFLGRATKMPGF